MNAELKKKLLDHADASVAVAEERPDVVLEYESPSGVWFTTDSVLSEGFPSPYFHRIKRAPKLRPFTHEEGLMLIGGTIRPKDNPNYSAQIITVRHGLERETMFDTRHISINAHILLSGYDLFNPMTGKWLPCGVEVEND